MTAKSAMYDPELREKIRLKYINDKDIVLTDDQISCCIFEMEEQHLSVFHGQLYPNPRRSKKKTRGPDGVDRWEWVESLAWEKSINGLRAIALRSGRFAGVGATVFETDDDGLPVMATVTVRTDLGEFVGEARYNEFVQQTDEYSNNRKTGKRVPNFQWQTRPFNQLSIAAERQALRKAFQDLGGFEACSRPDGDSGHQQVIREYEMYGDTRVLMVIRKGGRHYLALDNGTKAVVSAGGVEESVAPRTDSNAGGRPWSSGDRYYDGEIVRSLVTDNSEATLTLESGEVVTLDQWGKVVPQPDLALITQLQPPQISEETHAAGAVVVATDRGVASHPGGIPPVDAEGVTSVEELRPLMTPHLKRWCSEVAKARLSPKEIYTTLTGVVIDRGTPMTLQDYKVLYQCIEEDLESYGKLKEEISMSVSDGSTDTDMDTDTGPVKSNDELKKSDKGPTKKSGKEPIKKSKGKSNKKGPALTGRAVPITRDGAPIHSEVDGAADESSPSKADEPTS